MACGVCRREVRDHPLLAPAGLGDLAGRQGPGAARLDGGPFNAPAQAVYVWIQARLETTYKPVSARLGEAARKAILSEEL